MIVRYLSKANPLHLSRQINHRSFKTTPSFHFSSLSEWIRKFMNRIKLQDNRAIQARQDKFTIEVAQTPKQLDQKFIGDQQFKSLLQKQRMLKIDQAIGTRTYFHETKPYQERIDSDHVMRIDHLANKHPEPKRTDLNWENPQAPRQFKAKSMRKLYKSFKNLRTSSLISGEYPKHNYRITNFNDQKSEENIEFMAKQSLYSKLSLKWVDNSSKSIENETIHDTSRQLQSHRYSPIHVYFTALHDPTSIYRIRQDMYTTELLNSATKFTELMNQIEQVICLDEIYEVLKEYFQDERVSEWLRKVQNGEIGYVVSGYEVNQQEDKLVFWVDLLGDKKEYAHFYKNLAKSNNNLNSSSIQQLKRHEQSQNKQSRQIEKGKLHFLMVKSSNVIFNCKPKVGFSQSSSFFMIQRSEEGMFVELVKVKIDDSVDFLEKPSVIFKCKAYEELDIETDEAQGYLFVKVKELGKKIDKKIMILEENNGKVQFIDVQFDQSETSKNQSDTQKETSEQQVSRYSLSSCSYGLVVTQFYQTKDYFKFGPNKQFATKVTLIPFKSHIQLSQVSSSKLERQFRIAGSTQIESKRPSAKQIDFSKKEVLFICPPDEFITELSVRASHVILSLSTFSIYSKKRLYFLPFQTSKNPHSLIFNSQNLAFTHFGYCHNSQIVNFLINRSIVFNEYYQYLIWKKELKELTDDEVYIEKIKLTDHIDVTVTIMNRFLGHLPKWFVERGMDHLEENQTENRFYKLENSKVPVLIYLADSKPQNDKKQKISTSQTKSEVNLKKFLQKGAMVLTVSCRGTLSSDLITFSKGSGENFSSMLEDLEETIEWIGNNLGTNISFYGKGPVSGLVGMMLNVKYPFLLTSSVLHDGVYEVLDKELLYEDLDYFLRYRDLARGSEDFIRFWRMYNPATFLFKMSFLKTKKQIEEDAKESEELQKRYEQDQKAQDPQLSTTESSNTHENTHSSQKQVKALSQVPALKIGTLQNIVISCSQSEFSKNQARRMTYRLRQNKTFKYEEVYLKQFLPEDDEELFNLAYIWGKMKDRLSEEKNTK